MCRPDTVPETLAKFVYRYRVSAIWFVGVWMITVVILLAVGPVFPGVK
jgi:hypothetical protein